jgi:hypothetical protein
MLTKYEKRVRKDINEQRLHRPGEIPVTPKPRGHEMGEYLISRNHKGCLVAIPRKAYESPDTHSKVASVEKIHQRCHTPRGQGVIWGTPKGRY